MIQITRIQKDGGVLTKHISLGPAGQLISNGSACIMTKGKAMRVVLRDVVELGTLISNLSSTEAIALGALSPELPDAVNVTTKHGLSKLNGSSPPNLIARTGAYIAYRPGQPAPCLFDYDTKGMPDEVRERLKEAGGFWPALVSVIPELSAAARLLRRSTSTGIYKTETGEKIPGSNGLHTYVLVKDGSDIERFLPDLHARCCLAGFGWLMVGAGGQLLERSIVDRMVAASERLVFEASANLGPGLAQDEKSRRPIVHNGDLLDTLSACPPLTLVELSKLKEMRGKETHRLAPESAKVRAEFVKVQSKVLIERTGMSAIQANKVIERQCQGILLPSLGLPFDDEEMAGCTVADIIADPERFVGATLADPLEGVGYGTCKAKIMQRTDLSLWIHSFAHGRAVYDIKLDMAAVEAALNQAPPADTAALFVKLVMDADLESDEIERLRDQTAARASVTKRTIERKLKSARQEREKERMTEARHRRLSERRDPRPQIEAPAPDAPWLPQMRALNDVLRASSALEPPARDVDGFMIAVRERRMPNMHALSSRGSNDDGADETRLPAPAQPLLTRLDEPQIAELIERHIDYVTGPDTRSIHLATPFVRHYQVRIDDALPIISAIATLPIVLRDGTLLFKPGLDRERGIIFRVPRELLAVLPKKESCTPTAVGGAMRFLCEEWLCDVSTTYEGKCTLVSACLTLIERSMLADRPVFFLTAPRRGGGKTTTLVMLLVAITGLRPSAAAWSPQDEERRKALLAYLLEGSPCIIWDNIPRGSMISCPHIERACTTAYYTDRRLGVSENVATSAATIQFFTGNNIGPRGELSSRALKTSLEVERADPENRPFKHSDPIGWTEANRGRILAAMYTILTGNPNLAPEASTQDETRFHLWWRLVGSAVENAAQQHVEQHAEAIAAMVMDADEPGAKCVPNKVSFKNLFLSQEEDDEDGASLAEILEGLSKRWPTGNFSAANVTSLINDQSEHNMYQELSASLREFLFPDALYTQSVTAKATGKRLKHRLDEPVKVGKQTLCLKARQDKVANTMTYAVDVKADP